jgi:hypothetical protein
VPTPVTVALSLKLALDVPVSGVTSRLRDSESARGPPPRAGGLAAGAASAVADGGMLRLPGPVRSVLLVPVVPLAEVLRTHPWDRVVSATAEGGTARMEASAADMDARADGGTVTVTSATSLPVPRSTEKDIVCPLKGGDQVGQWEKGSASVGGQGPALDSWLKLPVPVDSESVAQRLGHRPGCQALRLWLGVMIMLVGVVPAAADNPPGTSEYHGGKRL